MHTPDPAPFDFTGRHVFVAGGSSGINLAIARAYAAHGADVSLLSRSPDKLAVAAGQVRVHGHRVGSHAADVRDYAATEAALAAAAQAFGPIDVLVSGAAGNFIAPALGMSSNGFRTVVDIDLVGTFNVLRASHAHLRRPGASLINISAPQARNPTALQAHACAAKAGVDMLTRVLAMEWAADGIRVNGIAPGPIGDTEGVRRLAPDEGARARMLASIPLARFGELADVANMALVLGSALAGFVTGAIIPVDGGSSLQGGRDLSPTLSEA
ncbi:oxidoreductase%2C short-chain dehydrogenase/reductase [Bordetella ansorpii]|uniref:Oxidoreductase, short-chain dehydrogenase/reductase n=1 Tax=Bordetella ansorpii TaxID=288768 RepID=A0A157NPR9_9BORD|nr:SDR family oxidoreductase [Bordetella ansorpii]SAI23090.1 oxidoreductase%2C short-chain dehydrogenase/reductase [Bordetella ansorpii]